MGISENFTTNEINDADNEKIQSSIRFLRRLIHHHIPEELPNHLEPKVLDKCLELSVSDLVSGRLRGEDLISAFGCGFGEYLVKEFGFKWLSYSDEYGEDLAVYHPKFTLYAFPLSSASKRFESPDAGTFDAIVMAFKAQAKL